MHKDVVPAQSYYDSLMKEADDLYWQGLYDRGGQLERQAAVVKQLLDKGEVWYPMF